MYLVINKCVTAVKVSNFSGHYLRNRSNLVIGVLGYIGIVQHKEHSPEVLSIPPGTTCIRVEVKQSHYMPGKAQRVPGGWGSQISRQSEHEGGKVVSLTHRPPLLPRKYSRYSFPLETESTIMRPNGLCQWKIPVTSSRIEPATFRLVAQCLNQLHHRYTYTIIYEIQTLHSN